MQVLIYKAKHATLPWYLQFSTGSDVLLIRSIMCSVKFSYKELNKQGWLMVELRDPEWSPDVRLSEWVRVGGTWLQLMCCTVSRRRVLNLERQRSDQKSEIGSQRWLRRNDKSQTRTTRKVFQSWSKQRTNENNAQERTMSKISRDSN